ncbi:MAG: hypothetical protein ACK53Y_13470, partial [bacterium]
HLGCKLNYIWFALKISRNFQLLFRASPTKAINTSTIPGSERVLVSPSVSNSLLAILRRIRRMILPLRVIGSIGAGIWGFSKQIETNTLQ